MTPRPRIERMKAPLTPLVAGILLAGCSSEAAGPERADVFVVQRGDLPIRVTEQAEIQPFQSTRIKNEMEGQTTVIYLIEEGKPVEKGDKLVELDASNLLERKATQGISLHRAEATRDTAENELEIRTKEYVEAKLGGENRVRIAEIDLEKFLGTTNEDGTRDMGEQEQQVVAAQANIQLAEEEVKLAKNKLDWSLKLHQKGFITKDELERDELDHQRRLNNLRVAQNELDILKRFTHPKELIRLQQAKRQAETDLEGIIARSEARLGQARADLEARVKEYDLALERYENLETQIGNAVIYAPTPGIVVYGSEGGGYGRREFVEEGATVRERQTLIELPDVSRMIAQIKVHEAEIKKVKVGQVARIKVDAVANREFVGRVKRVSPVADSGSRWSNTALKVYKTDVEIEGQNLELKPSMSASVTIIVAELEDVLYVPLQAVKNQGRVRYVWLDKPEGPVAHPVELGMNDFQFVEITDGLEEGDRVFLAVPPDAKEPEFTQPVEELPDLPEPTEATPAEEGTDDGNVVEAAASQDDGASIGELFQRLSSVLKTNHPELAPIVEKDRRAWMTNADVQRALREDEELKSTWEAIQAKWRSGGGFGGGQRRGGSGGGEQENDSGR